MGRKVAFVVLFLLFSLISFSFSTAFYPGTNLDPNERDRLRKYNPIKAREPGAYTGGHDAITSEAAVLKKIIHEADLDMGEKFMKMGQPINLANSCHFGPQKSKISAFLD